MAALFSPPSRYSGGPLIAFVGEQSLMRYARYTRDTLPARHTKLWRDLWLAESQASLSELLGVPEYLALSALEEGDSTEVVPSSGGSRPAAAAIRDAASSFVNTVPGRKRLPNVVILHSESTFDPNRAFRLSSRVDLPLWSQTVGTKALGPLYVNVVGGGSWVTDFEVITGVDSRLFGFQGFYANYHIAPMVQYSLARYLVSKGYRAKAFSTIEGDTYNYKNAFRKYGFSEFIDAPSLGMTRDWSKMTDRGFISAIKRSGALDVASEPGPFLYFVDTTENHGPHLCRNFASERDFTTTYEGLSDFQMNCQLNEYLRRAVSTSDAFVDLISALRAIEAATGRPYVVLTYGDHQPWDFTDGIYSVAGGNASESGVKSLRAVRTAADIHETIYHIVASEAGVIKQPLSGMPPATFLPTLLSAFVATSYDDLYFPENFYLFKTCGSDFAARDCLPYPSISATLRTRLLTGRQQ